MLGWLASFVSPQRSVDLFGVGTGRRMVSWVAWLLSHGVFVVLRMMSRLARSLYLCSHHRALLRPTDVVS